MQNNPRNDKYLSEIRKIIEDPMRISALLNYFTIKPISIKLSKILLILRKYRLRLSLNKYKFEDKLLYKLNQYISKYYGKKVEFNIVNLKSIAYNGDIFTQILTSRIRKEKSSLVFNMNALLSKVRLSTANSIMERGRLEKTVDKDFIGNKFKNLNISSILNNSGLFKDNLNSLLHNVYNKNTSKEESNLNNDYLKIRNVILDNIKYKTMGGAKLIVKGRLTRRYRADRAVYKLK
jgi:hypothetical protein